MNKSLVRFSERGVDIGAEFGLRAGENRGARQLGVTIRFSGFVDFGTNLCDPKLLTAGHNPLYSVITDRINGTAAIMVEGVSFQKLTLYLDA